MGGWAAGVGSGGRGDPRVPAAEGSTSILEMPECSRRDFFQDDEINRKLDMNESIEKAWDNWQSLRLKKMNDQGTEN